MIWRTDNGYGYRPLPSEDGKRPDPPQGGSGVRPSPMNEQYKLIDMPEAFTPRQLAEGAEREVRFRQRVYPRLIADGKMTESKAHYEIALMQAIAEWLRGLQAYAEHRGGK